MKGANNDDYRVEKYLDGNEWQARTNSAGIKETTPRYHTLAREIAGLDPIIEDSSGRSLFHINYRRIASVRLSIVGVSGIGSRKSLKPIKKNGTRSRK